MMVLLVATAQEPKILPRPACVDPGGPQECASCCPGVCVCVYARFKQVQECLCHAEDILWERQVQFHTAHVSSKKNCVIFISTPILAEYNSHNVFVSNATLCIRFVAASSISGITLFLLHIENYFAELSRKHGEHEL